MRSLEFVLNASVCRHAHALKDHELESAEQLAQAPEKKCPLYERCHGGGMLGRGKLQCIPGHAKDVAANVLFGGAAADSEIEDLARAKIFPPTALGFLDPYENPAAFIVNKQEILERVRVWAELILHGNGAVHQSETPPF